MAGQPDPNRILEFGLYPVGRPPLSVPPAPTCPSQVTNGYRLINGEGDGLPGLVVDVYRSVAVVKTDGEGAAAFYDVQVIYTRMPPLSSPSLSSMALYVAVIENRDRRRGGRIL